MPAYHLLLSLRMAVRQVMIDHERCRTYVTGTFAKSSGRAVKRANKHVKARLQIISAYMIYTGMIKQYKQDIYLNYGSKLR